MKDLTMAHEELEGALESPVEQIALFGKCEDMSKENNVVVQQVYQLMRDIKLDAEDNRSMISRRSSKSHIEATLPDPQRVLLLPQPGREDRNWKKILRCLKLKCVSPKKEINLIKKIGWS